MLKEISTFLGDNVKWVCQEHLGGVVLPINNETNKLFNMYYNPDDNEDLKNYQDNAKYYWVGRESDFKEKISDTHHFKDEIIYILLTDEHCGLLVEETTNHTMEE